MENTLARKLKQVPEGYLVMGVDPHEKRHAAVAITQDFTTQAKFKFDNTRKVSNLTIAQSVRMLNNHIRAKAPQCILKRDLLKSVVQCYLCAQPAQPVDGVEGIWYDFGLRSLAGGQAQGWIIADLKGEK